MPTPENPIDPVGDFDSDAHKSNNRMFISPEGSVVIRMPDGVTFFTGTADYILDLYRLNRELNDQVSELRSRFLPAVIKKLEVAACAAIDKGDDGRAEAYAMAVMLIRMNLKKE